MSQKTPTTHAAAKSASGLPFAKTGEQRRAALTHAQIASDLADFARAGGRIEVLGTTPLRRAPAPPAKAARAKAQAEAAAAATTDTP